MRSHRRVVAGAARRAAALAVAVATAACGGGETPAPRPGAALWVGEESRELSVRELAALEEQGVGELFVDAAELVFEAGTARLVEAPRTWTAPQAARATLVVTGAWPAETDAEAVAEAIAAPLRALAGGAGPRRLVAVGVHFDLAPVADHGSLGEMLEELRDELDSPLLLSAGVPAASFGDETVADLAEHADFLVAFVYGQRPGEREDGERWLFDGAAETVAWLESLGKPYFAGVVTLGTARVLAGGETREEISAARLHDLVWNRQLAAQAGATLSAVDRLVYGFEAVEPTRVGEQPVAQGQTVRVVTTSPAHVAGLLETVAPAFGEHHLGELYYRLPGQDEGLGLGLEGIFAARGEGPRWPVPEVGVAMEPGGGRRWLLQAGVGNSGPTSSDLGLVDSNWLEIELGGGSFGEVRPGDFYRFQLLRRQADGQAVPTLRDPDVLRLYAPVLEGGRRLTTGPIVVLARGGQRPEVSYRASFLAPFGELAEVPLQRWEPPDPAAQAAADAEAQPPPASR